jgi:peptide-methionine (R)-S-oxide reductase
MFFRGLSDLHGSNDESNMKHTSITWLASIALVLSACADGNGQHMDKAATTTMEQDIKTDPHYSLTDTTTLHVSLAEWKKILPADLYEVAFEKGTERPFTGKFEQDPKTGIYRCAVCGNPLFDASTKFESGTGWPSYYRPLPNSLLDQADLGHGMVRTEVICRRCGAHLGHVFEDGPKPTGLRYCINAVSLDHTSGK